jgi:hypothetical protein
MNKAPVPPFVKAEDVVQGPEFVMIADGGHSFDSRL